MPQSQIDGDLYVGGGLVAQSFTAPAASIGNTAIAAFAGISASKLEHQSTSLGGCWELFGPLAAITALTQTLGAAYAAGTIVAFQAWIEVDTTGADRTVTVDLQKSTGAGAYTTILSATIGFADGETVRTLKSATLSAAAYVAGDILRAIVTVAGAAGAQATGLSIRLITREAAQ